jgi:serine/threonine protein kinase
VSDLIVNSLCNNLHAKSVCLFLSLCISVYVSLWVWVFVQLALAGTPSLQTISSLGLQILDGLKDMHRRGYVFVDVKPDNFMVLQTHPPGAAAGRAPPRARADFLATDQLFFVDFGLMEKIRAYNGGGGQRENVARATLAGNASYCSLDVHACSVPAAKDDLEAVVSALASV